MELTLDYNTELFPLQAGQNVVLALASSLSRDPVGSQEATGEEDRDRDVWRPDGKGRRGFEDEYDYVMYGRVYRFDPGTGEVVCVARSSRLLRSTNMFFCALQDRIRIVWRLTHVSDRVVPPHDEHCVGRPSISINAKIDHHLVVLYFQTIGDTRHGIGVLRPHTSHGCRSSVKGRACVAKST
jgi:hypothetical protein